LGGLIGVGVALVALAGCELTSTQPDVTVPGSINDSTALPTIAAGALGDFAGAFGGFGNTTPGIVLLGGTLGDEWINSDYFDTHSQIENRDVLPNNAALDRAYRDLHRARVSNQFTAQRFAETGIVDPARARALNLAGFTDVLIAEHFCSGVPFSAFDQSGTITYGPQLSTQQMLDSAIALFDSAAAAATAVGEDAADQLTAAAVGKGRALLDEGRYPEAAAAVQDVSTDFVFAIEYSTNTDRERLGLYDFNATQSRFSLADNEGGNGIDFRSADDPRLPWEDEGISPTDGVTPLFVELKYGAPDASVPLATGIEARLIEAEAALQAGSASTFIAKLNEARDAFDLGLGNVSDPGSQDRRVDLLFRERAFDLALTGHRLGDMRRLARTTLGGYGRGVESVYPVGETPKGGGTYGSTAALPVPLTEQNNPNYDASACDPAQP
jgi:hypothetical protein